MSTSQGQFCDRYGNTRFLGDVRCRHCGKLFSVPGSSFQNPIQAVSKPTLPLWESSQTGSLGLPPQASGPTLPRQPQGGIRSRPGYLWIVIPLGVLFTILLLISSIALAINQSGGTLFAARACQDITKGSHITNIQTGTGFDQSAGMVQGATCSFRTGQRVYVVFTIDTSDASAQVVLKLYLGDQLEDISDSLTPDQGKHAYSRSVSLRATGKHKVEVSYNGTVEASITFDVS